jgi:hypothetical protein
VNYKITLRLPLSVNKNKRLCVDCKLSKDTKEDRILPAGPQKDWNFRGVWMSKITRYRWSLSSIGVTLGTAAVTLAAIQYLARSGTFRLQSQLGARIDGVGGLAVLISFVLAVVALFKNEPPAAALFALLLSMASFLLYVR